MAHTDHHTRETHMLRYDRVYNRRPAPVLTRRELEDEIAAYDDTELTLTRPAKEADRD